MRIFPLKDGVLVDQVQFLLLVSVWNITAVGQQLGAIFDDKTQDAFLTADMVINGRLERY